MGITRRVFLRAGALSGITAAVPLTAYNAFGQVLGGAQKGKSEDDKNSLFDNTEILSVIVPSVFEDYVGTTFLIRTDALTTHKLELVQVKERTGSGRLDTFSLLFSSPTDEDFPQATYLFEHEQIGQLPLFIVPVKTPKGMRYEAVFNRLRAPLPKGEK